MAIKATLGALRTLALVAALATIPGLIWLLIVLLQAVGYGVEIVLFAFGAQILAAMLVGKLFSFALWHGAKDQTNDPI